MPNNILCFSEISYQFRLELISCFPFTLVTGTEIYTVTEL